MNQEIKSKMVRKYLRLPDTSSIQKNGKSFTLDKYSKSTLLDILDQIGYGNVDRKSATKKELVELLLEKLSARQMYEILRCNGHEGVRVDSGKEVFKIILTQEQPMFQYGKRKAAIPKYCYADIDDSIDLPMIEESVTVSPKKHSSPKKAIEQSSPKKVVKPKSPEKSRPSTSIKQSSPKKVDKPKSPKKSRPSTSVKHVQEDTGPGMLSSIAGFVGDAGYALFDFIRESIPEITIEDAKHQPVKRISPPKPQLSKPIVKSPPKSHSSKRISPPKLQSSKSPQLRKNIEIPKLYIPKITPFKPSMEQLKKPLQAPPAPVKVPRYTSMYPDISQPSMYPKLQPPSPELTRPSYKSLRPVSPVNVKPKVPNYFDVDDKALEDLLQSPETKHKVPSSYRIRDEELDELFASPNKKYAIGEVLDEEDLDELLQSPQYNAPVGFDIGDEDLETLLQSPQYNAPVGFDLDDEDLENLLQSPIPRSSRSLRNKRGIAKTTNALRKTSISNKTLRKPTAMSTGALRSSSKKVDMSKLKLPVIRRKIILERDEQPVEHISPIPSIISQRNQSPVLNPPSPIPSIISQRNQSSIKPKSVPTLRSKPSKLKRLPGSLPPATRKSSFPLKRSLGTHKPKVVTKSKQKKKFIPKSKDHICIGCYRFSDLVKLVKKIGYTPRPGDNKAEIIRVITNRFTKNELVSLLSANGVKNVNADESLVKLRNRLTGGKYGEICTLCELKVLSDKSYQPILVIPDFR